MKKIMGTNMKVEQILQDLYIDSFFDKKRADTINGIISSIIEEKNVISHLILWVDLEAKVYILTDFSLFEITITKKSQSITNAPLNSLKKIDITKYSYNLYKFDRIFIYFEHHKFNFACNAFSDRVLEFLKLVDQANIKLAKIKLAGV